MRLRHRPVPLSRTLEELQSIEGSGWKDEDDMMDMLKQLRSDSDDRALTCHRRR